MSGDDPLQSTPEEKEAALARMRKLLSQRLTEGEILPMGFSDAGDTGRQVSRGESVASGHDDQAAAQDGRRLGAKEPHQERREVRLAVRSSAKKPSFEWVKRTVRMRPEHLLAFEAYCAATGRRPCDVLAGVLAAFMESEEFQSVVRFHEGDKA